MIAAQLFSFITFPIFTRVLTKEQYGILGLVTTTMYFAVAFAKAGLSDGIIRFYNEYSKVPEKKEIFSSTVMSRGFVLSVLTSLAFILLFPFFQKYLKISESYTACFMIMALYLFFNPLNIIVMRMLRVNDKTIFINVMQYRGEKCIGRTFLNISNLCISSILRIFHWSGRGRIDYVGHSLSAGFLNIIGSPPH